MKVITVMIFIVMIIADWYRVGDDDINDGHKSDNYFAK